ncbi:hypothetical protein KPP03845_100253 [Streptomyces xanthophaeus]|uniref:barstar family protein n=1 Tax=Streptomyces xanthophaeus TaxID=67385 RepID=UPI00233E9B4F|nr:barstar family protein [Streptomyces xanthophaeus]WCD83934.1 hypothetical protein KPP03845_100253 [Streptomyces xanthophaeus]
MPPPRQRVPAEAFGFWPESRFTQWLHERRGTPSSLGRAAEIERSAIRLAAGEWASEQDMHKDVAAALQFPDYYGHNLGALNDCLGDVACYGPYDDSPVGTGLVLSITDYDRFVAACPRAAQVVLDIVADRARRAAVLQRRFFCLIQCSDPDIRFEPAGAMPVMWNCDEWLDAERR